MSTSMPYKAQQTMKNQREPTPGEVDSAASELSFDFFLSW